MRRRHAGAARQARRPPAGDRIESLDLDAYVVKNVVPREDRSWPHWRSGSRPMRAPGSGVWRSPRSNHAAARGGTAERREARQPHDPCAHLASSYADDARPAGPVRVTATQLSYTRTPLFGTGRKRGWRSGRCHSVWDAVDALRKGVPQQCMQLRPTWPQHRDQVPYRCRLRTSGRRADPDHGEQEDGANGQDHRALPVVRRSRPTAPRVSG